MGGVFHHCVIDRFAADRLEHVGIGAEQRPVLGALRHRSLAQGRHFRSVPAQLFQKYVAAEGEDAAIPAIAAIGEEPLRCGKVGLLDERVEPEAVCERFPPLKVAIAGVGLARLDTEGHQRALLRQLCCGARGLAECARVGNVMVAGADQQDASLRCAQRGQRDRGRGVAAYRFGDNRKLSAALLAHQRHVWLARHHHRRRELIGICHPVERLLEQRPLSQQRQEGFGPGKARARPEACASAAAQDHGLD